MLQLSAPTHKINISVRLSGSKSISNRLLMIKEVLGIPLKLVNLSDSEDTELLAKALDRIKSGSTPIDIGHAGTDMRFLTALLATKKGSWLLTGSARMKQRPIAELVTALKNLGANIKYTEKEGFPPLQIEGQVLSGNTITINGSVSSQFISALLLIAPSLENGLVLHIGGTMVSKPYVELTVELLKHFGIKVHVVANRIHVDPYDATVSPSTFTIESDWSSASYWYSICALSRDAEIELNFLNERSLQADAILPKLFDRLGVKTVFKNQSVVLSKSKPLVSEFNYDFTECPDIAQTLAVTCFGLGIKATLTGLRTLKVKETDRIVALKNEIEKFGVPVAETEDTLVIPKNSIFTSPGGFAPGFSISTYTDHRMAMSFAPLSLLCKTLSLEDPEVINKSYPRFWEDLKSAGFSVNLQP